MKKTESNRHTELGDFLKTRRNKVKPEQLGLPAGTRRRTPGLRREEVAQLAGIGLTWYTWLEQGRVINVSDALLDSLSRVYMLTDEERSHLYALADKSTPQNTGGCQPVGDVLNRFLERLDFSFCPAYITDHRWNLVAWNRYATVIFGDFSRLPAYERNIIHMMFCNRDYMSLFENWELHAKEMLARFHATFARYIDDAWFNGFIQDMKNKSEAFASWWALYDIYSMSNVVKNLIHPSLGRLTFDFINFEAPENQGLKLLIYNPDDETRPVMATCPI